jgi:transposase
MGLVKKDDGWRLPDEVWVKLEPLLPPRPEHPLGCHNPRVPDRQAMDAILLVLRTGMQWNALKATGVCHPSSAYRRFRDWVDAGVFREFWRMGLLAYDALARIDWSWVALDGAMGKAPLGGEKNRAQPHRQSQKWHQAQPADGLARSPPRPRSRWRQHERLQTGALNPRVHSGSATRAH